MGISYLLFFIGDAIFYFYMDLFGDYEHIIVAEMMFMVSISLLFTHIIINMRYFAEKLEIHPKILLIAVPIGIVAGYGAD